jgi:transglutaminase-like putative cysteine protease
VNTPATARFHVLHETVYGYAYPAALSQQLLHLSPREFDFQRVEAHSVRISPTPDETHQSIDYFGNHSQYLAITSPHQSLTVTAESTVSLIERPCEALIEHSMAWEIVRDDLRSVGDPTRLEPIKYLFDSPHVLLSDALADYARLSFMPGATVLAAALDLTLRIHREFKFDATATDIATPLSELLIIKRGVCQDFAHLMIGCLRSIGIPCRYMSGYILTHPAPGKARLIGADASHAWVSVYCPSIGWVDFDPTNRCMVNLEHITLGWGRDFSDVTLLQGVMLGGGDQTLKVSVTVMPQAEWEVSFSG